MNLKTYKDNPLISAPLPTSVINIRFYGNLDHINVCRPSIFGNPFKIGKKYTRGQCIRAYIIWFKASKSLQRKAREQLTGKRLGCYCHPQACHANVLCMYVEGASWREISAWANKIL